MIIIFLSNLLVSFLAVAVGMIIAKFALAKITPGTMKRFFNSLNLLGGIIVLNLVSTVTYIINAYNTNPNTAATYSYGKLTTTALGIIYIVFAMSLIIRKASKGGFIMLKVYGWLQILSAPFYFIMAVPMAEPYKTNLYSNALFVLIFGVVLLINLSKDSKKPKQIPEENKVLYTEQ